MAGQTLYLIGLIGDEASVVGFLLGGIGQKTVSLPPALDQINVFIVDNETPTEDIEREFRQLIRRPDIGIVLITRLIADRIRNTLAARRDVYPIVLEIPAALDPFDYRDKEEEAKCHLTEKKKIDQKH
uniref:V-type proton ATPase subunit F n=1 Tax=Cacopsylla melanoneura TaxID=428564 RepID=A0A8D9BUC7_9HEMI